MEVRPGSAPPGKALPGTPTARGSLERSAGPCSFGVPPADPAATVSSAEGLAADLPDAAAGGAKAAPDPGSGPASEDERILAAPPEVANETSPIGASSQGQVPLATVAAVSTAVARHSLPAHPPPPKPKVVSSAPDGLTLPLIVYQVLPPTRNVDGDIVLLCSKDCILRVATFTCVDSQTALFLPQGWRAELTPAAELIKRQLFFPSYQVSPSQTDPLAFHIFNRSPQNVTLKTGEVIAVVTLSLFNKLPVDIQRCAPGKT